MRQSDTYGRARLAWRSALKIAEENEIGSIAFPCISTGVYRYPKREAAEIALSVILRHLKSGDYRGNVIICCFCDGDAEIYREAAATLLDGQE